MDPNFNPNATGGNIPGVDTIVVTSTDVYVGGDFFTIGGQPRLDLARLNPITGLVDGGRQSFDPDPLNGIAPSRVRTLQVSGDDVYVGGDFTTIGEAQGQIARLTKTGALTDFNPRIRDQPGAVLALAASNSTLYAGGLFFEMGGRPRLEYAQFTEALTPVSFDATDDANPASAVQPLADVQDRALFAVQWAGEDEGAGVRDFSVFSSEDGGPFTAWQTNTPATSAMFFGEDGRTYEFYSIARDLTGNVEVKRPLAEAATTVVVRADDGDGDGVPDGEDRCPNFDLSPTVIIDALDTGVANVLAGPAGCTLMDRILQAGSGARNRRVFVRRVDSLSRTWLPDALIDEQQAGAIRTAAAQMTLLPP